MNYLSLFSGAGGGDLACQHLLGWRCLGYVEWDKYCQQVLKQRIVDGFLSPAPIFGDIRRFIEEGFAREYKDVVEVVTAGFPCTPFSVAGKQVGADDPRNMWPPARKVLRVVRPRFAFLENVPGLFVPERITLYRAVDEGKVYNLEEWGHLLSVHKIRIALPSYFGRILGELAEAGYDAEWTVLGADDVGAPHRRKRLWLLGYNTNSIEQSEVGKIQERPSATTRRTCEMADTKGKRVEGVRTAGVEKPAVHAGQEVPECRGERDRIRWWNIDPAELADTECFRSSSPRKIIEQAREPKAPCRKSQQNGEINGSVESRLDRVADGLASGLDFARTIGPGKVSRVATGVRDRVARLKALGNGQVPVCAAAAWHILTGGL